MACVFSFEQYIKGRENIELWKNPFSFFEVKWNNLIKDEDKKLNSIYQSLETYLSQEITDGNNSAKLSKLLKKNFSFQIKQHHLHSASVCLR